MNKVQSEGVCVYCNKTVKKQGLSRHIATHLKQMELETKKPQNALHLVVSAGPYFLHLLVPAICDLADLDYFLRDIWLECCGHISAFSHVRYGDDIDKDTRIGKAFERIDSLFYAYDFGSTTELGIANKGIYNIPTKQIVLVSRNQPLPIMCSTCQKLPATCMCIVHYDGDSGWYCKVCAPKHKKECSDFADYAKMPVVNSPRCGVCGYTGGIIDKVRDGVYKLPI